MVCGGPGIVAPACNCLGDVEDCKGICGGLSVVDECNVCGGTGIQIHEGKCDCTGNEKDCAGTCGGDACIDECGVCGG